MIAINDCMLIMKKSFVTHTLYTYILSNTSKNNSLITYACKIILRIQYKHMVCAAYMRWWTGSELVPLMACHLDGAKPLSEPMLIYCLTNLDDKIFYSYHLIRAPYTRIAVPGHISNIPTMISQSQISCNTHTFYIAAIFVKCCYTTGSWLF